MCIASLRGHRNVARRLLLAGADMEIVAWVSDTEGAKAVDIARRHGHAGVVELLDVWSSCEAAARRLYIAAYKGDAEQASRLMAEGVDVNLPAWVRVRHDTAAILRG